MKKKLTAVLLTLCMVLGMLPMSAFAAWSFGGKTVTPTLDADNNQYYSFDVDGTRYYAKADEVVDGKDVTIYYDFGQTQAGKLTWTGDTEEEDQVISTVAVTLSTTTAKVGDAPSTITASSTTEGVASVSITGWTLDGGTYVGDTFTKAGTYTAKVEAAPAEGYKLANNVSYTGTLTVTVEEDGGDVDSDLYYVTVEQVTGGTITVAGLTGGKAAKGTKLTVNVEVDEGYKCTGVTVETADVTKVSDTQYTFVMPESDVTVTAAFEEAEVPTTEYSITVAEGIENGTVTTDLLKAAKDATVTITATPNAGYQVKEVTAKTASGSVDVIDSGENYQYTFTMPGAAVTVSATFELIPATAEPVEAEKKEDGTTTAGISSENLPENIGEGQPVTIPVTTEGIEDAVDLNVTIRDDVLEVVQNGGSLEVSQKVQDVTAENGESVTTNTVTVTLTDKNGESVDFDDVTVEAVTTEEEGTTIYVVPVDENGVPTGKAIPVRVGAGGKIQWTASAGQPSWAYMSEEDAEKLGLLEDETEVTLTLDKTTATVTVGSTVQLNATVTPAGTSLTWTSSDSAVATVSATGLVTGVKAGTATITVAAGGKTATCAVTVQKDGGGSSSSGGGSSGGGGGSAISHNVNSNPTRNGSVSVRPGNAAKGEKVTITLKPNEGYVLDTLTVKDANGKEVTLTKVDDTTYTFVMPETTVTVDATFKAAGSADEPSGTAFSDVTDKSYTFYDDIYWVAGKGYMSGYSDGTFRPSSNTTRQALWMVLARIDGANPADMNAARSWAMANGVSDGTNPSSAMTRQQMVTMLYRYAELKGYKTTGGVSIDSYPDAAGVADYAKDAVSWAAGNGILRGTSSGNLNPTGTASRANFAAFLHRFCETAGID